MSVTASPVCCGHGRKAHDSKPMATQLLELDEDVILGENAKEAARVSSDLRSLQSLRLDQLTLLAR